MAKSKNEEKNVGGMVPIEVPICGVNEIVGPEIRHLDGRLKPEHRVTLARVRTALAAQHATLRDGKHVESQSESIRWILEQIEAAE